MWLIPKGTFYIIQTDMTYHRTLADLDGKAEEPYKSALKNRDYWEVMGSILEKRGLNKEMDVMNIFQV